MSARLFLSALFLIGCSSSTPVSSRAQQLGGGKSPPAPHPNATFPYVSAFQPEAGKAGDVVKLIGGGFTGATAVAFSPALNAPTFTVDSDTQITVTIPVGAVSGSVFVTTALGTGQSYYPFSILSTAAPTITDFSPKTGGGNTPVQIFGTNFAGTTRVTINGFPSPSFDIVSDTQVAVNLPRGVGTGMVVVTNNIGSGTSAATFVGTSEPRIANVTPAAGKPGDLITLTGAHFTGATTVNLGSTGATFTVVNDSTLTFTVPAAAASTQIYVLTPNGDDYSDLFQLLAAGPPTVTMVSPLTSTAGKPITITGTNLVHVTQVQIGGVPVTPNPGSPTSFTIYPARTASGTVTITNNAGSVTSTDSVTIGPAPSISSYTPVTAKIGDTITIAGSGLTGATLVHFGNGSVAPDSVSDTQVVAKVPTDAMPGQPFIDLPGTTVYGPEQHEGAQFRLLSAGPPTITSFTPANGTAGATVRILGTNLVGATSARFAGFSTQFVGVVSDSEVTVSAAQGAPAGPITIVTNAGNAVSTTDFTPVPRPVLLSYSPTSGKTGDAITIKGVHLSSVLSVEISSKKAVFTIDNDGQITATVPAGVTNDFPITISETSASSSSVTPFTVSNTPPLVAPRIASFHPAGLGQGASVQVMGVGFTGATQLSFNGVKAMSSNVQSDTLMTAVVPPGATSGVLTITTPRGNASSVEPFTVLAAPTVASIFSPPPPRLATPPR